MTKEKLSNIISYLESLKEKDGDYKKYLDSLDLLANRLLDYYTPHYNGEYMDMTEEEYNELDSLFQDAIKNSEFFLETEFADEENKEARDIKQTVTKNIHDELLTKYYNDFKSVKLEKGKSFFEQIQKPKQLEVLNVEAIANNDVEENKEVKENKEPNHEIGDISQSNIYNDGLFQKDKMVVTYDNEKVSGTFIYKTNYDPDKQIDNLIQEFAIKYPEYQEYFVSLNDINTLNELSAISNEKIIDKNGKIVNFFNDYKSSVSEIDNFNEYKNKLSFLNANAEFIIKLRPVLKEINELSVELKAKNDTNLDRRNVAMTNISKLFDATDVVTNARAVAIEKDIDGEKVYTEGTFIDDPKGKTVDEFSLNDPIHTASLEAWDTVEAKKALSKLQILDYISGNRRDIKNIKFDFDPKTNKLVGVQGINNEKSFFTPTIKKEIIGEEDYSGLENIKVIDGEMAQMIMSLEESEFTASMINTGLSKTEIHEAWRRVENLKEVIRNPKILDDKDNLHKLFKEEKFVIVNGDEAWSKLSLNDLKAKNNIFEKVINAQKSLVNEAKVDKSLDENYKILKFSYNNKVLDGDKFLAEAKRNAPLFGTSKRYTNILKGLNEYNKASTPEEKASKLDGLQELVDVYNIEKVKSNVLDEDGNLLKNLSGKELGRVNLVKNLEIFIKNAKTLGKEVDLAFKEKTDNEKKVEEFNSTYRLGKYKNYAKVYKNENNQILINANILEREKQNTIVLSETAKKMIEINNGVDLDKNPISKQKYEACQNYIETTIKSCKEQLLSDYHHGVIPKEYFDYKNEKYDHKIFDFKDEEQKFAYENPESEIFKNNFQDQIAKEINDNQEEMIELKDFSNKQELEINGNEMDNH